MTDVTATDAAMNDAEAVPVRAAAADAATRRLRIAIVVLLAVRVAALLLLLTSDPASQEGGITGDVRRYQEMATASRTASRSMRA